jgi:hypothetical protein
MKELILYNHFHNGDIFYSRMITQALSKHYDITFLHKLTPVLFEDNSEIKELSKNIDLTLNLHTSSPENGFVNTWIGQYNMKYVNMNNCSFRSNYILLTDICKILNIEVPTEEEVLPVVNYEKVNNINNVIKDVDELKTKYEKLIFISTGPVHSAQSSNFDFTPIIRHISLLYKNYCFIVTTDMTNMNENVINASKLTQKTPDLLLLSYISTKCDVIIGRSSGPYCFTHVKENLLNPNKTFISFSRTLDEGMWYDKSIAKNIWSNNYDPNNIIKTIIENL